MTDRLFTTENLDEYRQNPDIQNVLYGVSLLNHDEFMNWYSPPQVRLGERKGRLAETLSSRLPAIEAIQRISKDTMRTLTDSVCEYKISSDYGKKAIDRLNENGFDVLVAIAPDHEELNRQITTGTKALANRKIKHILGFIIVEKGECKKYPEEFCVNLICARAEPTYKKSTGDKRERVKGALLMGAYLYCLKKQGKQMGILELAGGYNNVTGFISYTRMGYAANKRLYGSECFVSCQNLPMSVSMADTTYEQIIGRASGKSPLSKAELKKLDPTGLSLLLPKNGRQTDIQKIVASLCNLIYKLPYITLKKCVLDTNKNKRELELLYSAEEQIRQENRDTTYRPRALSEGEIDEYEPFYYEPTLQEIITKLEYKKYKLIDMFELESSMEPEVPLMDLEDFLMGHEPLMEPEEPFMEETVPFIQAQAIKANKTKRKRTPLLMDDDEDEGPMYVGLGKRMSKRPVGKGKKKRKNTQKRRTKSR